MDRHIKEIIKNYARDIECRGCFDLFIDGLEGKNNACNDCIDTTMEYKCCGLADITTIGNNYCEACYNFFHRGGDCANYVLIRKKECTAGCKDLLICEPCTEELSCTECVVLEW